MSDETTYTACALDPLLAEPPDVDIIRLSGHVPIEVMADAMPQIVWTATPDGTRDYFNQRWYEHTGQSVIDTLSEKWIGALHEDDREPYLEAFRGAVAGQETFEYEYRLFCVDDGTYRWHLERALPLLDPSCAVIKWFGTCTDVEEMHSAHVTIEHLNGRLRRAMVETHHRVKNNLQIILAMVDMQMADQPDSISIEELRRLSSHIRTIAAVHDILTRAAREEGEVETVPVKDVLEQLLPIHQQTAPHCVIEAEIQDVDLAGRKGTSLALVINELVSNAIKHGRGLIKLVVTPVDGQVEVTVCDNGPGFPAGFDPVKAANTGLELIDNLVRWDLNGRISFGNQPIGGGQVSVTVPLAVATT